MKIIEISKLDLFRTTKKFIVDRVIFIIITVACIIVGFLKLNYIAYLLGLPIGIYYLIKSVKWLLNIIIDILALNIDKKTGTIFEISERRFETGVFSKYYEIKLSTNKTYLLYSKKKIGYKVKSRVEIVYLRRSKVMILCNEI